MSLNCQASLWYIKNDLSCGCAIDCTHSHCCRIRSHSHLRWIRFDDVCTFASPFKVKHVQNEINARTKNKSEETAMTKIDKPSGKRFGRRAWADHCYRWNRCGQVIGNHFSVSAFGDNPFANSLTHSELAAKINSLPEDDSDGQIGWAWKLTQDWSWEQFECSATQVSVWLMQFQHQKICYHVAANEMKWHAAIESVSLISLARPLVEAAFVLLTTFPHKKFVLFSVTQFSRYTFVERREHRREQTTGTFIFSVILGIHAKGNIDSM